MARRPEILWNLEVEDDDFPAAASYLSLIYETKQANQIVARLRRAKPAEFKAKDIFRASQLAILTEANFHVARDRRKIKRGTALNPILLVRDPQHGKVIIADGYHRMCAVYGLDEDAVIPCRIV